jgi:acyl-coenzyme A synthetase/AMP-(fatty) acid ligase
MLGAAPVRLTFSEFAETAGLDALAAAGQAVLLTTDDVDDTDPRGFAHWLDGCTDTDVLAAVAVGPGDPALIGFTSGSTGQPKLVETSHLAVFRSSEAMQAMFGFDTRDVFCTSTDFSALSALRSMLTMPLLAGGQVVLPTARARTQPLALGLECAQFGVTRLTAIPNVLRGMASARDRLPSLPRLRMMLSGSGVLDRATHDSVANGFGVRVIDYFGAREFGTVVFARADGRGTVTHGGGQICNALIRIVDDQGVVVPDGAAGEIMVHTDAMSTGPLAGSHPGWEAWHQTGDLGRIMPSGELEVTGRRRDVIKAGDGSLVFPVEIEALLNDLPGVCESCVLGWPGQSGRDHIIAAVVLDRPEHDGFAGQARAHVLQAAGRFRVPTAVLTVPGFDRVGNGKIDKAALRERLSFRVGYLP